MIKKPIVLGIARYPKRTGVLKKEAMKNVETETNRVQAERKVKAEQKKKLAQLTELDFYEEEQPDVEYDNEGAIEHEVVSSKPLKRRPLTTIAHNYTFWADLIFEPKCRTRGMVLFVEEQAGGVGVTLSRTRVQVT